ncbi:WRKY transcription factor 6 [Hibiscus syriacus]|uniref:WRKY transcription factor 6 n=1 Tax=Hibiscus syriacus TaxID=106335 RepID=A0A6A3C2H5_HIBSY|nr:WRKY transcription factor 6-like [Hibiscus syriacus]KAE8723086.1 WRKY transcription factor 6 [Hibiscus syriacus]
MDKGWGLTLESDTATSNFFSSKTSSTKGSFLRLNQQRDMFQFPISLAGSRDDSQRTSGSSSSPSDDTRIPVDEVDFFSDKKSRTFDDDRVKKEHGEPARASDLDVNTGLLLLTGRSDQSTVDDGVSSDMEDRRAKDELAQLQVELKRMNAENQKLKDMLSYVGNNYTALQMHLVTLMQQQQNRETETIQEQHQIQEVKSEEKKHGEEVMPFKILDPGPSGGAEAAEMLSIHSSSEERTRSGTPQNNVEKRIGRESPESESWGPNSKVPKLTSGKPIDQSVEATMRKARVSVRARSQAPMITDGCQWRKYGQKMAKGNPCPRAYYRCTMAAGCPVRKQVQRCADDRTILITTYEGNHNHPLPAPAMAMASTTAAAASMLLSGSMPSADGIMNQNLLARAILPCSSSMATISASAPFPTVTLDLTHSPNPLQFRSPPPPPLQPQQFQVPFYSQPQNLPQIFGQPLYNQSKISGLQLSHVPHPQFQQPQQPSLADTVTAAITNDPGFTAALAAAIKSIIGGSHPNSSSNTSNNNTSSNTK